MKATLLALAASRRGIIVLVRPRDDEHGDPACQLIHTFNSRGHRALQQFSPDFLRNSARVALGVPVSIISEPPSWRKRRDD